MLMGSHCSASGVSVRRGACPRAPAAGRAGAGAAVGRKPLGEFLQNLFLSALGTGDQAAQDGSSATLQSLGELADAHPVTLGTAGPLNRDELYERGLPGH
ncbi:hypothetical protein LBMAG56_10440 [Verrucomicrobiota bacterium]|nr:hypothetical protein LBMAG56_10440 [Verrucomicrobiota bacterium]